MLMRKVGPFFPPVEGVNGESICITIHLVVIEFFSSQSIFNFDITINLNGGGLSVLLVDGNNSNNIHALGGKRMAKQSNLPGLTIDHQRWLID